MIDRQRLLNDLKPLLRELEADLRARCDEVAQINEDLQKEYDQARTAERTGVTFEEWRADLITQVAVAWELSCVFVRFLEDNALISPPRISGPLYGAGDGQGLMRARDEWDIYLHKTPDPTHRGYLLAAFDDLAKLPGTKDVFGPHNPVSAYRNWLSGDAAQKLVEFFQKIDTDGTGEIIHDFTDPDWDTRFLGDLYQDLSEAARKKYALLQTPVFVEEFILERTLEPAIKEFNLKDFKMIDPACGSGHFLLGAFTRILNHWRAKEPGLSDRELVNRTIASVHGVDLNPFAVAIARFRLLVAAMRECRVMNLEHAPTFALNLVCGDSLLHGVPGMEQQLLGFHELAHAYQSEDLQELGRILRPGTYHAVVANPPYIIANDPSLNSAYRARYGNVCHMRYSLSAPFTKRLFDLGYPGAFVGQITSNSFMKRAFGKKLVENYLPKIDLSHVIDTSGAYIPGHGTPTIILFGRNRKPVAPTIRAVMGIRGEPATPADPAQGLVWSAIVDQVDRSGSESEFVSVANLPREQLRRHPWSIGGGGITECKVLIDSAGVRPLRDLIASTGFVVIASEDDAFYIPTRCASRHALLTRPFITGESIRDWALQPDGAALFPYDSTPQVRPIVIEQYPGLHRHLWRLRTRLRARSMFGKSPEEHGLNWYEYLQFIRPRVTASALVIFANIATHNQFILSSGGVLPNQNAPVVIFKDCGRPEYLDLLSVLNSSTAGFWLKQVCHNKGSTVDQHGARQRTDAFEDFYAYNSLNLEQFPVCKNLPSGFGATLDDLAQAYCKALPGSLARNSPPTREELSRSQSDALRCHERMIAWQEELDWECYSLYGLVSISPRHADPPPIRLGERAFEIVLARKSAGGDEETTWFARHGSEPITELPKHWPADYRAVVQERIDLIENDKNIALIERPEYKRRWNTEPWESQKVTTLRDWLLDRVEGYFDFDGRMSERNEVTVRGELREPRLTSVATVADLARKDKDFMQVAELYTGRMDFEVGGLLGELVAAESVPALPVLRYKPAAMDKRSAWERTWELQRQEDAVDALFEAARLAKIEVDKAEEILRPLVAALRIQEQVKPAVLYEAANAAAYVAEAVKQKLNLTSDTILQPVHDAANRSKKAAVGDIPVPPKYTSADFLSSNVWRLRGKLDVPKERWVSFPYCEGEDGTLVIAWAGYDHLQLVQAIAERYELAKEQEGRKLVPLLATIGQLIPWLKQWHNEIDPVYGTRMGDYFEGYLAEESKALGMSVQQVTAWTPPEKPKKAGRKKN